MKDLEIGTVRIDYDDSGKLTEAVFTPSMQIELGPSIKEELAIIGQPKDPDILRAGADLVMAAWFSKMNEIEMADRRDYGIDSTIKSCIKNESGKVKSVIISYVYKQLNPPINGHRKLQR